LKFNFWLVTIMLILSTVVGSVIAGTTPPSTVHSLSGTAGQAGWFRSDIDVTLTVTDTESGPDSTTYWIDSGIPTVVDHATTAITQFLNRSFESGSFFNITDWYAGLSGWVLYYRDSTNSYEGNRSAAILFGDGGGNFYHWHNEPHAIMYPAGTELSITAWSRRLMFSGDEVFFEVWGQDSGGNNDQLIATSPSLTGSSSSWQNLSQAVTVPDGANYVYLKLGAIGSPIALIHWDYVTIENAATSAEVEFTFTEEGDHLLHYFSQDNAGNVESEKTTDLKKDTVAPNPWQTFSSSRTTCDHCYETSVEIRDATSGVDTSTAEYRYYTEHGGQLWSDWSAVDAVTLAGTGAAAADGETEFVVSNTPSINFGDSSSGPFRLQYRIYDLAGNSSTSPVYEISAPWLQTMDGSVYIGGEISVAVPGSGDPHATADVLAGDEVASFVTTTNWKDDDYIHAGFGATVLESLLPEYAQIKSGATLITDGRLPRSDGVYLIEGDFGIDSGALHGSGPGYEGVDMSAVVIVTGDLAVNSGFTVVEENNTVFLVEGDLLVDKNVEDMAGFYIAAGVFNSDPAGNATKPLRVDGSVVSLGGFELTRDLGDQGPENNSNTPAERFTWQPDISVDQTVAGYLTNRTIQYQWQEVARP